MALTESTGHCPRTQLQQHLGCSPTLSQQTLCTMSSDKMEVYVASLLIHVKHINSSLQRTMIKHWRHGFNKYCTPTQHHSLNSSFHPSTPLASYQLPQQEQQRLTFIKEYRAAYASVCKATDRLEAHLQLLGSVWDLYKGKSRRDTANAFQDSLLAYHEAVAELVLNLLPGQLFLEVYSQEDSCQIFKLTQASSECPTTCLSTHLPLGIPA